MGNLNLRTKWHPGSSWPPISMHGSKLVVMDTLSIMAVVLFHLPAQWSGTLSLNWIRDLMISADGFRCIQHIGGYLFIYLFTCSWNYIDMYWRCKNLGVLANRLTCLIAVNWSFVLFINSIYEKLIKMCGIDEQGTNYPPVCTKCFFPVFLCWCNTGETCAFSSMCMIQIC